MPFTTSSTAARTFAATWAANRGRASLPATVAIVAAAITLGAIALLLLIPALVIGAVAFGIALLWMRARRFVSGLRRPNGALDGRKNVRVIVRRE